MNGKCAQYGSERMERFGENEMPFSEEQGVEARVINMARLEEWQWK
jgi:hypothetical protein